MFSSFIWESCIQAIKGLVLRIYAMQEVQENWAIAQVLFKICNFLLILLHEVIVDPPKEDLLRQQVMQTFWLLCILNQIHYLRASSEWDSLNSNQLEYLANNFYHFWRVTLHKIIRMDILEPYQTLAATQEQIYVFFDSKFTKTAIELQWLPPLKFCIIDSPNIDSILFNHI